MMGWLEMVTPADKNGHVWYLLLNFWDVSEIPPNLPAFLFFFSQLQILMVFLTFQPAVGFLLVGWGRVFDPFSSMEFNTNVRLWDQLT